MRILLSFSLICSIVLFSCQEKNSFEVVGKVNNLDNGKIIIMSLHEEGKMDTVQIKNGSFSYKGVAQEPTPYLLFAPDILPGQSLFYANKGKVKITFDANDPQSLKIEGDKTQDEYNDFNKKSRPLLAILDSLQDPMLQTQEGFNMDDLRKRYTEVVTDLETQTNSFIAAHPKSYFSALLANESLKVKTNYTVEEKEAILQKLDPSIQSSYYGEQIKKLIANTKLEVAKQPLPVGSTAPDFELATTTDDKMVRLSDFKGKYVLLDFWASWCGPCRQENPNVLEAYLQFKDKNFDILAVSLDKEKEPWNKAIIADNLPWTHVSDLKGFDSPVAVQYDIQAIPSNYLIDPNGVIIAINLRGEALAQKLKTVLK